MEYLRATGSPTHLALRSRVRDGKSITTPAPVVAAAALENRRPLLARNRDFAVVAQHTELELVIPPDPGKPKKPPRRWSGE